MAYNETPIPSERTTMLNKIKNLDPQTKLFIKATTLVVVINAVGFAVVKTLESTPSEN